MKRFLFYLVVCCCILVSCKDRSVASKDEERSSGVSGSEFMVDTTDIPCGIDGFIPGDIIVRANNNWLPGSAFVPGGYTFGHAAIVIQGSFQPNTDSLLAEVILMESNSRNVSEEHQVRSVPGFYIDPDPDLSNRSFGPQYKGIRYRLRLPLSAAERDSIIAFIRRQDDFGSSWRALKSDNSLNTGQEWYCTLIIRAAFLHVKGIDLDANAGWIAYPNDLIVSPWFDNNRAQPAGRIRF